MGGDGDEKAEKIIWKIKDPARSAPMFLLCIYIFYMGGDRVSGGFVVIPLVFFEAIF